MAFVVSPARLTHRWCKSVPSAGAEAFRPFHKHRGGEISGVLSVLANEAIAVPCTEFPLRTRWNHIRYTNSMPVAHWFQAPQLLPTPTAVNKTKQTTVKRYRKRKDVV